MNTRSDKVSLRLDPGREPAADVISNFHELVSASTCHLRETALNIAAAGILAGDPGEGTKQKISLENDSFKIGFHSI